MRKAKELKYIKVKKLVKACPDCESELDKDYLGYNCSKCKCRWVWKVDWNPKNPPLYIKEVSNIRV